MSCAKKTFKRPSSAIRGKIKRRRKSTIPRMRSTVAASYGFTGPLRSGVEKKYYDRQYYVIDGNWVTWGQPTADTARYNTQLLNCINNGAGVSQRVGRKITMTSAQLRVAVGVPTGRVLSGVLRCILVYDSQPNGVTLGPNALLESTAGPSTFVLDYQTALSPVQMSNRDRLRVIMDKQIALAPGPLDLGHTFKKYKRLRHETVFNTDTQVDPINISSIQTGALYMFYVYSTTGGAVLGATNLPSIVTSVRLRYTDQ